MAAPRFPPPGSIDEGETYFVVKDGGGQKLGFVYFDDPRAAAKPLTRDEALHQGPRRVPFRLHDPRIVSNPSYPVLRARNRG